MGDLSTMARWTGADATLLRQALRMTVREFAAHLGISTRTVSLWAKGATQELRPVSQAMLDTALQRADPSAQERFQLLRASGGAKKLEPENRSRDRLPGECVDFVPDLVEHLRAQWHALVRADNLLGPRHALAGVLDQIQIIEDVLPVTGGAPRRDLVQLGAMYAESAAWLYEDTGRMREASAWVSRSMEWAHEADDRRLLAWTLFRRSQHAAADGDGYRTLGLAAAAGRADVDLPGPMRAALLQQEACGHALNGDEIQTHRALDRALERAASDVDGDARDGHGSFCTEPYLEVQRAHCWVGLGRPQLAIRIFETAIPALPAVYRRDRGVACSRLAHAYAATGQVDAAAETGREALAIARRTGSIRTEQAVARLDRQLAPHRSSTPVRDLHDELGST